MEGTKGRSFTGRDAQFWSLESPLATPNYAEKYGIPPENFKNLNFIETVTARDGNFVTRPAPSVGANVGRHIEVVVPEGSPGLINIEDAYKAASTGTEYLLSVKFHLKKVSEEEVSRATFVRIRSFIEYLESLLKGTTVNG